MAYGLPEHGALNWDEQLNNSMEHLRQEVESARADANAARNDASSARSTATDALDVAHSSPGPEGPAGQPGKAGPSGKTAFEVAKDAGFPGSLDDWLSSLRGNGVSGIERTAGDGSAGTLDTYTVSYTDGNSDNFKVRNGANGRGITSVIRSTGTGAPGDTDIYTITYTDNTTSTFTVVNGELSEGGNVRGPADGAVVGNVATYADTTGELIADSGIAAEDILLGSANLGDVANAATARTNLGLGNAATKSTPASGAASSSQVVNGSDPRLTDARTPLTHTHTSAQVTDFVEATQDAVAALLQAGTGVTLSYNDAGNTLTITGLGDPETVRDTIGAALVGVGLVNIAINDAADTITISTTATQNSTDAQLRDRSTHTGTQAIGTVSGLQAALDGKVDTTAAPELIRDTVGATLAAGSGVSVVVNDATDTITISSSLVVDELTYLGAYDVNGTYAAGAVVTTEDGTVYKARQAASPGGHGTTTTYSCTVVYQQAVSSSSTDSTALATSLTVPAGSVKAGDLMLVVTAVGQNNTKPGWDIIAQKTEGSFGWPTALWARFATKTDEAGFTFSNDAPFSGDIILNVFRGASLGAVVPRTTTGASGNSLLSSVNKDGIIPTGPYVEFAAASCLNGAGTTSTITETTSGSTPTNGYAAPSGGSGGRTSIVQRSGGETTWAARSYSTTASGSWVGIQVALIPAPITKSVPDPAFWEATFWGELLPAPSANLIDYDTAADYEVGTTVRNAITGRVHQTFKDAGGGTHGSRPNATRVWQGFGPSTDYSSSEVTATITVPPRAVKAGDVLIAAVSGAFNTSPLSTDWIVLATPSSTPATPLVVAYRFATAADECGFTTTARSLHAGEIGITAFRYAGTPVLVRSNSDTGTQTSSYSVSAGTKSPAVAGPHVDFTVIRPFRDVNLVPTSITDNSTGVTNKTQTQLSSGANLLTHDVVRTGTSSSWNAIAVSCASSIYWASVQIAIPALDQFVLDPTTWIEIPLMTSLANGGVLAYATATSTSLTTRSVTPTIADLSSALAVSFTAPPSGSVVVSLQAATMAGSGDFPMYWLLRDASAANVAGSERWITSNANNPVRLTSAIRLTGLTPGDSYTYRWAARVGSGTGYVYWGGASYTGSAVNGAAAMEVRAA